MPVLVSRLSDGRLELDAMLPVGVENGTIIVPRPPYPATGDPTGAFVVTESGGTVWDGRTLVCKPDGITSVRAVPGGVAFEVTNGAFEFVAQAPHRLRTPVLPPRQCSVPAGGHRTRLVQIQPCGLNFVQYGPCLLGVLEECLG